MPFDEKCSGQYSTESLLNVVSYGRLAKLSGTISGIFESQRPLVSLIPDVKKLYKELDELFGLKSIGLKKCRFTSPWPSGRSHRLHAQTEKSKKDNEMNYFNQSVKSKWKESASCHPGGY
jgi:hypothetical protein